MELEVGMYVRTLTLSSISRIGKLEKIDDICITDNGAVDKNQIIKASHNITELIEERDFVKVRIDGFFINWFMVDLFEDENENEQLGIGCYEDGLLNSISEYRPLNTLEILEVVTKEQFEAWKYEIK